MQMMSFVANSSVESLKGEGMGIRKIKFTLTHAHLQVVHLERDAIAHQEALFVNCLLSPDPVRLTVPSFGGNDLVLFYRCHVCEGSDGEITWG